MSDHKDLLKEVDRIHSNIGNDSSKETQAFSKICNMIANEEDTSIRIMFIKEIAKNYDYTKTELSKAVNDLIKKRNSKTKNKEESISLIDRQEKAIATNFDIHYNEISLNWKITEYEINKEVTDYDIIRKLRKQHININ